MSGRRCKGELGVELGLGRDRSPAVGQIIRIQRSARAAVVGWTGSSAGRSRSVENFGRGKTTISGVTIEGGWCVCRSSPVLIFSAGGFSAAPGGSVKHPMIERTSSFSIRCSEIKCVLSSAGVVYLPSLLLCRNARPCLTYFSISLLTGVASAQVIHPDRCSLSGFLLPVARAFLGRDTPSTPSTP